MATQKGFQNRSAGFYVGLAGGVLAIVALIFYVIYGNLSGEWNMLVMISLVVSILIEASAFAVDNDVLTICAPVLCAVSLCALLMESVYTFVAYFYNLAMFGDITMMGPIVRVCIFMAAGTVLMLAASFMKKNKAD